MKIISNYLSQKYQNIFIFLSLAVFFYITVQHGYLVFHVFIELITVVIAFSLFTITWNSRKMLDNQYLLLVGMSALFIGVLDTLHTITYKGMNIIVSPIFYANQFWVATRFLESITLLFAFLFLKRKIRLNLDIIYIVYSIITLIIILSILYWEIFPLCFVENVGQTKFKIYCEYVIIVILVAALILLLRNKHHFEKNSFYLLAASIFFAIVSEFCFTLYISNYGFSNQLGHYSKLLTFYLIYKANIEAGFVKPTETIFNNLKISEQNYRKLSEKYELQSKNLSEQNMELEVLLKQIRKLNEKLIEKNKKLDELNATKDKFFSIIAHDLKNPFTSILGFSEILSSNQNLSCEKIQYFAKIIHTISQQTYSLLENLLNWSRMQTGSLTPHFEEIPASELLTEIMFLCEKMTENKKIQLNLLNNVKTSVFADREMIKTVLRNLVINAIKFTYPDGRILVEVFENQEFIIFSVSDTGIGIEQQHLEKLFKIESKLSKLGTSEEKGTGLGLILCKEFVEKNNGKIWCESEIGKGSKFSFSLPKKFA